MDDQACLTKGVTFVLKDNRTNQSATFFYKEGLKEFFQRRNATKTPLVPAITIEGSADTIRVEVVFGWFKDEYSQRIYSLLMVLEHQKVVTTKPDLKSDNFFI